MKIILAPDSFKGSLSAIEVTKHLSKGIRYICSDCEISCYPIADGGEGTVDTILKAVQGKKVLVISPEMSKIEVAERFFVVEANVDFQQVVEGGLPTKIEERFERVIHEMKDKDGLYIMDADDDLSPKGIDAAIHACQPDLVACDSMYDLRIKGERADRMLAALEWAKEDCKKNGYAFVGFAQQNRVAEKSKKEGGGSRLGTIALTDAIGQDAHTIIALEQTKDDKADKIMKFVPLKARRGYFKKSKIRAHWDFSNINFSELTDEPAYEDGEIPF